MKADLLPTNPLSQLFMNLPPKASAPSANSTQTSHQKLQQGTKIIGNYLLGKNIGQGTFGKVHLAMHIPTSQKVAVKIIDKAKMRTKDVQRVKCEIQILKTVKHRHVLELYEIIETEKSLLLVTEFLPNGELFRHIIKQKKIPEDQACVFFQQIIQAVQYLHRNRVAHRDLKPENILIDYDKQLKVIDFGLGSFYDEKNELKTFCGSPCYAAPEMVEAKRNYNPLNADIWSCGVILFAMLCGHLPFCDADTHTLFKKIMTCSYKIPSHVSPQAQDLISKLLVLTPSKRLSLAQIKDHKWFNRVSPIISYGLNRGQQLQADESILSRMRAMGIDEEKVRIGVQKNQKAKDVATYFILMKKMARGGELIPSYIGGDHFNPQFIKSEDKMGDQPNTESYNDPQHHMVVIESPDAPDIPTFEGGKEAQAMDNTGIWYSDAYNEEEPREIDERELMLLANSILDIFMPKKTAPSADIQKINEVISPQNKDNPLKKLLMEKKDHEFYQNNEELAKKRLNLHLQRKLTKNNGDSLTENPSKSKLKPPPIRFKAASELKRSISKRQRTQKREDIIKGASEGFIGNSEKLESNNNIFPKDKQQKKKDVGEKKQSTLETKLELVLPVLPKKYDPKTQSKIREITKRYKIYRAFIH